MKTVDELFEPKVAKSAPFDDHDAGNVAFVTNGFRDNGLLGYVAPLSGDRIFREDAICVSAFCEATVPQPPFIARGNGGSGLTVLVPKTRMSTDHLWAYASYLSNRHGWKFSFGRMATKDRLKSLEIPDAPPVIQSVDPGSLLPRFTASGRIAERQLNFAKVPIKSLFDVRSGDFHRVEDLASGDVPLISCGARDNGIIGFYNPPADKTYRDMLTVAYNGDYPLMAKFHPYNFAAKDDVAVLHPRRPLDLASKLFIQMLLNREVWRHSYGRKLYRLRLEKFELKLPVDTQGGIDEPAILTWLETNPLWPEIGTTLKIGLAHVYKATLDLMADSGG
jgi:hypothetical protein